MNRRARRRLVGAIALVVFVVIALPIVLDREPKPVSQDLTIEIPSQDAGKFSSRILPPQADAPQAAPAPSVESKPEAAKAEAAPKDIRAEAKPEPKSETKTAPAAKPAPAETAKAEAAPAKPAAPTSSKAATEAKGTATAATAAPKGFVVPLGLFSRADNIKQVRSKASAAGFKTFTETLAKDRVRVRAGPFDTRDAAEKAREKLKSAGLDVGAVASQ